MRSQLILTTRQDELGGVYYVRNIEQLNPQIFAWLDLLDLNVWVILISDDRGCRLHHDFRSVDNHHRTYQYDWDFKSIGSQQFHDS